MRKLITCAFALTLLAVCSANVQAGEHKTTKPCPHCGRYHTVQSYGYMPAKEKKGMFAKMWEMEQRKNAWLKRTFLGR